MKCSMSQSFTSNHTPDMLSYHPGFLIMLQKCTSIRWWVDPRRILWVWICYHAMAGVLYSACTMLDRCGTYQWVMASLTTTPHIFSTITLVFWSIFKTAPQPGCEVIRGGSCRHGYAIILWQEQWVMNRPCLTGVEQTKHHGLTANHTQDMLSYHPGFLIKLPNCASTRWGSCSRRTCVSIYTAWLWQNCWIMHGLRCMPQVMASPPMYPRHALLSPRVWIDLQNCTSTRWWSCPRGIMQV